MHESPRGARQTNRTLTNAVIVTFLILLGSVVLATGFWDQLSANVLSSTTWGLYSKDFFSDLLISLHGNLADLLVVGIILYSLEQRRLQRETVAAENAQRENAISRNIEALEDLRYYRGEDAAYRTLTAIKRLVELKVRQIVCPNALLEGVEIDDLDLSNAKLHGANFKKSRMTKVAFEMAVLDGADFSEARLVSPRISMSSLHRAKFVRATLDGVDFRQCKLERADFTGASLRSANFAGVDCKGVKFDNCDLTQANFIDAKNLPVAFPGQAIKSNNIKLNRREKK